LTWNHGLSGSISEAVQDGHIVKLQRNTNRKSYVTYPVALISVTLNDLEDQFINMLELFLAPIP